MRLIDAVEQKRGHWIVSDEFFEKGNKNPVYQVNCSVCNGFQHIPVGMKPKKYCGDCGAKMDEEVVK